jgi:hypothetical protein
MSNSKNKLSSQKDSTVENERYLISTSDNMKYFTPYHATIEELIKICENNHYSAIRYLNNSRSEKNFIEASLGIFDFDEGLSLEEAKKEFSPYAAIILTTKSHQKDTKSGKRIPKTDRFRVAIPLDRTVTSLAEYKCMMKDYSHYYGSDRACVDGARFFYPNPSQIVWISSGIKKLDTNVPEYISSAKSQTVINKRLSASKNTNTSTDSISDLIENDPMLMDSYGEKFLSSEFAKIASDVPVLIHCPNPKHKDLNPSCFVVQSNRFINKVFIHCHKCGRLGTYPKTTTLGRVS